MEAQVNFDAFRETNYLLFTYLFRRIPASRCEFLFTRRQFYSNTELIGAHFKRRRNRIRSV